MELFDDERRAFQAENPGLDALLERLKEISPNAYNDAVYALYSEYPIEAEVIRFARNIINAAEQAGVLTERGRRAAEQARGDRLDPAVEKVQAAAWKTAHEFDRMRGLLRFSAAPDGLYIARCEPDHFVLPLLAGHFLSRFGDTPWMIIDEKRGAALVRERGKKPVLRRVESGNAAASGESGGWEQLWRTYHRAVNNEARANPGLQKQFMPQRYWKYLPEMRD